MRKLSPVQKRILAEITWDARTSHEDIARRLKVKPHTVRHAVKVLDEMLSFKPRCWSNPFLQGCWSCRVYFSTNSANPKRVKDLIAYITAMPEVIWFASLIGNYQFAMAIRGNGGLHDFTEMFDRIDALFGDIITDKAISNITQFVYFIPWLAHAGSGKRRQLQIKSSPERVALDELDRTIIKALHERPLISMNELARRLGSPATTLRYRFDELVKKEVFIAFGLAYHDRRAGFEGFFISISTRGLGGVFFDALHEYARMNPHVLWIGRSLGTWNIELGIELEELRDLERIVQEVQAIAGHSIREMQIHTLGETFKG